MINVCISFLILGVIAICLLAFIIYLLVTIFSYLKKKKKYLKRRSVRIIISISLLFIVFLFFLSKQIYKLEHAKDPPLQWSNTNLSGDIVADNKKIFMISGCGDNYSLTCVSALEPKTGKETWHSIVTGPSQVSNVNQLFTQNGYVYLSLEQSLYKIAETNGASTVIPIPQHEFTTISDGGNIFFSDGKSIISFNPDTEKIVWTVATDLSTTTPYYSNGFIYYISLTTNTIHALNAATGLTAWISPPYAPPEAYAVSDFSIQHLFAANGILFVISGSGNLTHYQNTLLGLDQQTGKLLWKNSALYDNASFSEWKSDVYISYYGDVIQAIDSKTGRIINKYTLPGEDYDFTTPVLQNGILYFAKAKENFDAGYHDVKLDAFDIQKQTLLWELNLPDEQMLTTPIVIDNMLYYYDNGLHALSLK